MTAKIFHPLLALIASASNNELAKYVEFLKEENKILRARIAFRAKGPVCLWQSHDGTRAQNISFVNRRFLVGFNNLPFWRNLETHLKVYDMAVRFV